MRRGARTVFIVRGHRADMPAREGVDISAINAESATPTLGPGMKQISL